MNRETFKKYVFSYDFIIAFLLSAILLVMFNCKLIPNMLSGKFLMDFLKIIWAASAVMFLAVVIMLAGVERLMINKKQFLLFLGNDYLELLLLFRNDLIVCIISLIICSFAFICNSYRLSIDACYTQHYSLPLIIFSVFFYSFLSAITMITDIMKLHRVQIGYLLGVNELKKHIHTDDKKKE